MTSRFLSNLTLAVLGGFLVVATMAWTGGTVVALTFAVGIAATVVGLAMLAGIRHRTQRGIGAITAALGAWTIVASLVFASGTVHWLGFASALGFVGLAITGLVAHELHTERVVHELEVVPAHERGREPAAA